MAVMTDEQAGGGRETRWSANKKTDAVLRLLRGERLDELSRELRVEAHRLAAWRDEFLAAGKVGLKGRLPTEDGMSVEQRRLREAERKVGELTLDNDILRAAARKGGSRCRRPSGRGERRAAGAAGPGLPGAGRATVDRALPHSPDRRRRHPPRTDLHVRSYLVRHVMSYADGVGHEDLRWSRCVVLDSCTTRRSSLRHGP